MSFLKIKDPAKRERVVKEFLKIKKNIRANELAEKTGKIELREDLSELFKPVTEAQKTTAREIMEGLRPIKEGIEQLPQRLPQQIGYPLSAPPTLAELPPPYDLIEPVEGLVTDFAGPDPKFGVYYKSSEFFISDKHIYLSEDGKIINIGGEEYLYTPGLYKLLALKDPIIEDIPAIDVAMYRKILVETNTMYTNNDPKTNKLKTVSDEVKNTEKWDLIILPAWERMQGKKKRAAKKGYGLKKVVLPSDPNALLERLDLLIASKAAGNTGLRNELVSVCDELKRQGILNSKCYKKITSLL